MSTYRQESASGWSSLADALYQEWAAEFLAQTVDRIGYVTEEDLAELRHAAWQEAERRQGNGTIRKP